MLDWATLLGGFGAFAVVVAALLLGGSAAGFVDVPSVLLVLVGSPLIVLSRFPLRDFLAALVASGQVIRPRETGADTLIGELARMAEQARKGGLLALENAAVSDGFMRKGVALMVDGHEPDQLRNVLMREATADLQRRQRHAQVFRSLAEVAPAMGMIGTLIGLVQMLGNMSDPASVGPAMAVALLTTLYGALLANLVAAPIADKLLLLGERERWQRLLIIDGLTGIQLGQNPRLLSDLLRSYEPVRTP